MPDKNKPKPKVKKPAPQSSAAAGTGASEFKAAAPTGMPAASTPESGAPVGASVDVAPGAINPNINPNINPIIRPPIFHPPINPVFFLPAINSLTPAGATVGGGDFTLTVNGSNFANDAVVLWNNAPRATTFVSATEVTASIVAADIASVTSASVVVKNNSSGLASGAAAFNIIPDITAILGTLNQITQNFASLAQFTALQPSLGQALADLNTYLTDNAAAISELQSQLSAAQNQIGNLSTQNGSLTNQVTQLQATVANLQAQLAISQSQTAAPVDVALSFKNAMDQIHQQALNAGGMQTTVTNMQVQLKALVNVQASTATAPLAAMLVFPDPNALPDANSLSTVNFSFSAIPRLQGNPTPSPTPSPGPTPSVATRATPPSAPGGAKS